MIFRLDQQRKCFAGHFSQLPRPGRSEGERLTTARHSKAEEDPEADDNAKNLSAAILRNQRWQQMLIWDYQAVKQDVDLTDIFL